MLLTTCNIQANKFQDGINYLPLKMSVRECQNCITITNKSLGTHDQLFHKLGKYTLLMPI